MTSATLRGIGPIPRRADVARARKRRSRLNADRGSTSWAPRAIGWWIGILFAVGATCFAVGALPG